MLQNAKPHVLIILDCCFAANAARDTTQGVSKEILAASSRENPALGAGVLSFTSLLVDEMRAFGHTPFTVAMLYARLVTMRRTAFTPNYVPLSESRSNSITICPMPKAPPIAYGPQCPTTPLSDSSSKKGIISDKTSSADKTLSHSSMSPSEKTETRVFLSISVTEEVEHNVAQWVSWLTTAVPPDVLRVEYIFRGHSTLVLVSIPIIAWSRLRKTSAYRFIGFIKSEDLLCETKQKPLPGMTTRLQTKKTDISQTDSGLVERHIAKKRKASPEASSSAILESMTPPLSTPSKTRKPAKPPKTTTEITPHRPISYPVTTPSHFLLLKCATQDTPPSTPYGYRHASQSWSPQNDELLMQSCQRGMNWQPIANTYFPDKTANSCRKRHGRLMEKRNSTETWEGVKIETLARAYVDVREQMWRILADRVDEQWQIVEAMVYLLYTAPCI